MFSTFKDAKLKHKTSVKSKEMEEITIVATALVLLVAGYDTTATTLSYAGIANIFIQSVHDITKFYFSISIGKKSRSTRKTSGGN